MQPENSCTLAASVLLVAVLALDMTSCSQPAPSPSASPGDVVASAASTKLAEERPYLLERVGDAAVVQLYADGFDELTLKDKTLVWHLYQAAIAGRDIYYDQRYAHGLEMRDVLEAIVTHPTGVDRDTLAEILRYTKLFWLNAGPYANLTARKFTLQGTPDAFAAAAAAASRSGATFPLGTGESLEGMLTRMTPYFFDANVDPMVTAKTPPPGKDILTGSANNLHVGLSMEDLDGFREEHPLNSRLVKTNGRLTEEVYKVGGRYSAQISAIVSHLEAAIPFATQPMAAALEALIRFYRTGDMADHQRYDIAWVADKASPVDTINGFVEVYLDARGRKGAWESLVFYVNHEKTAGMQTLAKNAQWFEDHTPWDPKYRKPNVQGITANAIDVVVETGDSGPITPVGINLPNDQRVRESYGSKSVTLSNVSEAYDKSTLPAMRSEFSWSPEETARATKWSAFAGDLFTNLHEVIGHASGKTGDHLKGQPQAVLKEQYSALEEARADLVALYFFADPKLAELGLLPAADQDEIVRAQYEAQTRNVLVQLRRVRSGTQLEEDHMRNRQMIINWMIKNTKAVDVRQRDGKTYYVMTDPKAFREGAGRLLAEVQRIKSEGEYTTAKALFETYGVYFDAALRDEIVARVDRLNLPSYTGFVMPKLDARTGADGTITNVTISYPRDLTTQMLEYSAATRATR